MSSPGPVSGLTYYFNKYLIPNMYVFTGTTVGVFLVTPMVIGRVPVLKTLGEWEYAVWAGIYAGISNSVAQQMQTK
jgi:hypothetical protein